MEKSLLVAELICARICDEIGGLVGPLKGSLELEPGQGGEAALKAMGSALEASGGLAGRIALFRGAWAETRAGISVRQLAHMTQALPRARRLRVDLTGLPVRANFPVPMSRMILNALLLAMDCLPRGGTVSLSAEHRSEVMVAIEGIHAAWPAGLARMLADPELAWAAIGQGEDWLACLVILLSVRLGIRLSLPETAGRKRRSKAPPPLILTLIRT